MLDQFNVLSESELSQLKDGVSYVTILIAGADGKIDKVETAWAEKVVDIRSYHPKGALKVFYEDVAVNFPTRLKETLESLPAEVAERNVIISQKLEALNPILAKLDQNLGADVYKSFLTLAEQVAKSAGGILGFFNINAEEAKWLKLSMIQPIVHTSDEEE